MIILGLPVDQDLSSCWVEVNISTFTLREEGKSLRFEIALVSQLAIGVKELPGG